MGVMSGPTQHTTSRLVPNWKPPQAPPTPTSAKASTAATSIGHGGTPSILNQARNAPSPAPMPAPLIKRDERVRRETAPEKTNIAQAVPIPTILNTAARSTPMTVRPARTKTSFTMFILSGPGAIHHSYQPTCAPYCTFGRDLCILSRKAPRPGASGAECASSRLSL